MAPVLLGLRSYPLFIGLAVVAGLLVTIVSARRLRVPLWRLAVLEAAALAAGVAGAKLFWLWEIGALHVPWHGLSSVDGLRYPGGLAAMLIALPLLAPRLGVPALRLGDVMAPAVAVAMAVVRVGCLLQGCCFGPVSNMPWAIEFPLRSKAWSEHVASGLIPRGQLHSLAVHPLQVYFALWSLIVAVLLMRRQRQPHREGDVVLAFLLLHEGGKAALELLRVPPRPELQIVSATIAVAAGAGWLLRRAAAGGRGTLPDRRDPAVGDAAHSWR